ncbi:zinc-ribbon domain containing protein [Pseudoduganella violaceinigra]|uniref:zinc-ribbon domain containing protein n=1 Tax=Pseudoduganella violaceinigra TaxID=246602 RepID=UPI0004177ABC|nr:zinc-ribbon domain containing protein [Pseudoduganella violaceinigra]
MTWRRSRDFIFFALEQRYWYEARGFYVDSECVRCVECRHKRRVAKRRHQRYTALQGRASLSREEMMQLVDDCIFLLQQGMLKKPSRLDRIKHAALRQVPEYAGAKTLQLLLQAAYGPCPLHNLTG